MTDLTPEAQRSLAAVAERHGVSVEAASVLVQALAAGGGTMAQFNHPELGGVGQPSIPLGSAGADDDLRSLDRRRSAAHRMTSATPIFRSSAA